MIDRRLIALLRVVLGILFIVAAWPKLADPAGFAQAVSHYRILPEPAERALALTLPPLEMLCGICLVLGVLDAGASAVVLTLMVVFTAAVFSALLRGLDISCGCFDTDGGARVGLAKVAENVGLSLAAAAVAWGDRSWMSFRSMLGRPGDIE